MAEDSPFLGTGWSWPPQFNPNNGEVDMTSGVEDINNSLRILLSTTIGERMMHPSFGCETDRLLYEPITVTLRNYMKVLVNDAILFYEPRIILNKVLVDHDELNGIIQFTVDYTITGTNSRTNLVFPFYLNEANNL